jgi:2-keto-4-pentenoate hydratase
MCMTAAVADALSVDRIAERFVQARLSARALPGYPGAEPRDLAEAYAVQEAAIGRWPDPIAGWKVGRIAPPLVARFGAERLAGPIFARNVWAADGVVRCPIIRDGFAAVEAEFVFRLDEEAPADRMDWSYADAAALKGELLMGVEIAGSPLKTINDLGPAVVVSDFGNNAGLILGGPIPNWRERLDGLRCETFIEGRSVGQGGAASIPGSPLEAVRFLAEVCARRGRPLKAGQYVSTGAATGIHDILPGQRSRVEFDDGFIECEAVEAAA